MDLYKTGVDVLTNPKHSRWIAPWLIAGEAALCALILWRVACTSDFSVEPGDREQADDENAQIQRLIGSRT